MASKYNSDAERKAAKLAQGRAFRAREKQRLAAIGTSNGQLRKLPPDVRERFRQSADNISAALGDVQPRKTAKKTRQPKHNFRATSALPDGAEYVDTTAGDFRAFVQESLAKGINGITLAITMKGRRVFVSQARTDISNMRDEERGGGRGASGRNGARVTKLEMWSRDPAGLDPEDLMGLINFYGNPSDALYVLWELNDSPTMHGRKR